MTFEEFLKTLDISGENYLVESGTPQKLRHYTDIKGLRNILRAGFLRPQPYYFDNKNKNSISVTRPTNHTEIDFNDRTYCGYFEIDFHILNDKIKNITKSPINEIGIEYRLKLEKLAQKYHPVPKEDLIKICNELWEKECQTEKFMNILKEKYLIQMEFEDAENFMRYYYNLITSLYYRESEERIYGNDIPLNAKYIKFIIYNSFFEICDTLNKHEQSLLYENICSYKELFYPKFSEIKTYFES